jgi:UTP:GlnB (protein PII) uridylyltransferase
MTISRKELEISTVWAKNYPHFFMKSLMKFHEETINMKQKRVDTTREGFITYIAEI